MACPTRPEPPVTMMVDLMFPSMSCLVMIMAGLIMIDYLVRGWRGDEEMEVSMLKDEMGMIMLVRG